MKIVINIKLGGYELSKEAYEFLGLEWDCFGFMYENDRTNPKLIEVVEKLGKKANGKYAFLKVIEIPDDVDFYIFENGGVETVVDKKRCWD